MEDEAMNSYTAYEQRGGLSERANKTCLGCSSCFWIHTRRKWWIFDEFMYF